MTTAVITDQKFAPNFIEWLDERCPGVATVEGQKFTLAYVEVPEDGIARKENVLTVCLLSRWTAFTCEATLATNGAKRNKADRQFIWSVFNHVFNEAGRTRLYTFVQTDNIKSIAIQHMLGLREEARLADHFGDGKDAFMFGITKKQWQEGHWNTAIDK